MKCREWMWCVGIMMMVTISVLGGIETANASTEQVTALLSQAEKYEQANEYEKAIESYTTVLKNDAQNAQAYSRRGWLYSQQEQHEAAIADFRKAADVQFEQDHLLNSLLFELVQQQEAEEKFDTAIQYCIILIELNSFSMDYSLFSAYLYRAWLYQQLGNYEAAISDVQEAIAVGIYERDVKHALGYANVLLGRLMILAGQLDDAAEPCQNARELRPLYAPALAISGHLALLTGDRDTARMYYETAVPLFTTEEDVHEVLADFQVFIAAGRQVEACRQEMAWIQQAWEAQQQQQEPQMSTLLADRPFDLARTPEGQQLENLFKKALNTQRKGWSDEDNSNSNNSEMMFREAAESYTKIIEQDAAFWRAYLYRADCYEQLKQYDLAIADLHTLGELLPEFGEAWGNMARILLQQGKYDEAFQACYKAHKAEPRRAQWIVTLGHLSLITGDIRNAKAYYRKTTDVLWKSQGVFNNGPRKDVELFKRFSTLKYAYQQELSWMERLFDKRLRQYQDEANSYAEHVESKEEKLLWQGKFEEAKAVLNQPEPHARYVFDSSKPSFGGSTRCNILGSGTKLSNTCMNKFLNFAHLAYLTGDKQKVTDYFQGNGGYLEVRTSSSRVSYSKLIRSIFNNLKSDEEFLKIMGDFERFIAKGWQVEASESVLEWLEQEYYRKYRFYLKANKYLNQAEQCLEKQEFDKIGGYLLKSIQAEKYATYPREERAIHVIQIASGTADWFSQHDYPEQAIDIYQWLVTYSDLNKASIFLKISQVYQEQGQYQEALNYYEHVLELARKDGNTNDVAVLLNAMSQLYTAWGKPDEAEKFRKEASELSSQTQQPGGQTNIFTY